MHLGRRAENIDAKLIEQWQDEEEIRRLRDDVLKRLRLDGVRGITGHGIIRRRQQ